MKFSGVTSIAESVFNVAKKHSPEILTGIGITGMITSIVMAIKATPKAMDLIAMELDYQNGELIDQADEKGLEDFEELDHLSPKDLVRTTWKIYAPMAATCIFSIICLIQATSLNCRRNAALATAYSLSETAMKEYRQKVVDTIGERKEQGIRDAVAKDKVNKSEDKAKHIVITEKGGTLCLDALSNRYFHSDINKIKKVVNELNRKMLNDGYVSLNDFYSELDNPDLEPTRLGDDLGWNISQGLIDLNFSSQLAYGDTPCLTMDYCVQPRKEFQDY